MADTKSFLVRELIQTEDGSSSLYIPALNETYHNRKGAIREAEYIFINRGLKEYRDRGELAVLEVGFGTGLNALLTMKNRGEKQQIFYMALEPYPLNQLEWETLNYPEQIGIDRDVFDQLHLAKWNEYEEVSPGYHLNKIAQKLENWVPGEYEPDLVYFDAFAPSKQAEVWGIENLRKIFNCMKPGGLLLTYSAQGILKRNLRECGFICTHPPGPMGKKEMTLARKV